MSLLSNPRKPSYVLDEVDGHFRSSRLWHVSRVAVEGVEGVVWTPSVKGRDMKQTVGLFVAHFGMLDIF